MNNRKIGGLHSDAGAGAVFNPGSISFLHFINEILTRVKAAQDPVSISYFFEITTLFSRFGIGTACAREEDGTVSAGESV